MNKFEKLLKLAKENGVREAIQLIVSILARGKINNYNLIKKYFAGKSGLEIGGPSGDFKDHGFIPLYKIIRTLDGCNFAAHTIWEGDIGQDLHYHYYKGKKGIQFISDATHLNFSSSMAYDFVISSNCLEHVANPLEAIQEWVRVLKKDGLLLIIVPHKDYCFDHNRSVTAFSHLLDDYRNNVKEDDLTHVNEIISLHDLTMDKASGNAAQFRERSLNNFENRALHHHVFNNSLLKDIYSYFELEVLLAYEGKIGHIILGKRS